MTSAGKIAFIFAVLSIVVFLASLSYADDHVRIVGVHTTYTQQCTVIVKEKPLFFGLKGTSRVFETECHKN